MQSAAFLPSRRNACVTPTVTVDFPSPAGEGKSTVTVGVTQALRKLGKNAALCIREPSLGPVFGVKGGAAGGGYSQVIPMEDINLHFTGDFHAIASAHNLLSAMLDAHLHHGNALGLDTRRITWPRTIDMNDRALRSVIVGLGGLNAGPAREERFVIIPGSEIMAIMALATGLDDLEQRLARIIVGLTQDKRPVRGSDLKAHGAMTLLLKDAINPNLVQTLEGGPAFIHCGPFGNIAHGCNSVVATKLALALCDVVLSEAGFGADLGAEKFFDIKCRAAGLNPEAAVVVARTLATTTAASGFRPAARHLMSKNFSAPRSAPKPASESTTSHSASASLVATTELQPWAMLPNGPQWMNAGPPSSVCTRLGLIASFRSRVIAPCAFRSLPRTGRLSCVSPTMMRASRCSRSSSPVASAMIAMISEPGMMTKRSSRAGPAFRPPSPTMTLRSARSFMSIVRGQVMRRVSSPSALPWWRCASSIADSRLCALAMAWKSPVKWRLMSSIGITCE